MAKMSPVSDFLKSNNCDQRGQMDNSVHSLWSVEERLHFENFWEVSVVVVKRLRVILSYYWMLLQNWFEPHKATFSLLRTKSHSLLLAMLFCCACLTRHTIVYHIIKSGMNLRVKKGTVFYLDFFVPKELEFEFCIIIYIFYEKLALAHTQ